MRPSLRWGAALLCAVLHSAVSPGQVLPFRIYTARDGLTRNEVRCLCQDANGFLWFGTSAGLDRYDGASFDRFVLPGGLRGNLINDIVVDSSGAVWVSSNFNGVTRFEDGRFETFAVNPDDSLSGENRVNTILPLHSGTLLIGTDAGLFQFAAGKFTKLFPSDPLLLGGVECILALADGSLLVGTYAGICFINPTHHRDPVHLAAFEKVDVRHMVQNGGGDVWVGTNKGLRVLRVLRDAGGVPVLRRLPGALQTLASSDVRSLLLDSRGSLWIGTETEGAFQYAIDGSLTCYSVATGLPSNKVRAMLEDRERDLWFATSSGVAKETGDQLANYLLPSAVGNTPITSIAQDALKRFWFGTARGLAKYSDDRFSLYSKTNGLASDYILALSNDQRRRLWVGTTGGLSRLETSAGGEHFTGSGRNGVFVRTVLADDPDGVWVGLDNAIALLRGNKWFEFPLKNNARKSGLVLCILRDLTGSVWVGTQADGIFRFEVSASSQASPSLREIAHYAADSMLVDENIRSGFVDRDGNLWFGTRFRGALHFRLRGSEVVSREVLGVGNGLSGDWVRDILQDQNGDLWFATNGGVDRLSRDPFGNRHIRSFTIRDGLAGDEAFSLFEDGEGDVWIGASAGVTRYSPGRERPGALPPPVWIRKIQILGNEDTTGIKTLSANLASHQHTLAFDFVGISLRDESGVRYRYKLEGFDSSWSAETDRRYATYTHLPPGRYAFNVIARNAEGQWSASPAVFRFSIAAPFWQSWWFILLSVLSLAGVLSGLHLFRVRKLLELERVRTRIAADLHDDLGSTLGSISVFSEMARREVAAGAPKAADYLVRIGESSRNLLGSLDDIVWSINPGNDALDNVVLRVRDFAGSVLEAGGIHLSLSIPPDVANIRLPMEIRRQFYLFCKEAIVNIARHSQARHASLAIDYADGLLSLSVNDDGIGLPDRFQRVGNGLHNMRFRATAMGGTLQVGRTNGHGTAITLLVRIP